MKRLLCAALALWSGAALANDPDLIIRPVPLDPDDPAHERIGALVYRGGLNLSTLISRFGGLSSIEISENGQELLALSDRGRWWRFALTYGPDGRLTGARWIADRRMQTGLDGGRITTGMRDSEAMAPAADGLLVAFEQRHRIWRFPWAAPDLPQDAPAAYPGPDADQAPDNGGMEALAPLDRSGSRFLALAEQLPGTGPGTRRAWVGGDGDWQARDYLVSDGFEPTGADLLPDGDVIVIERKYELFVGVSVRVVRLPRAVLDGDGPLTGMLLAQIDPPLTTDNFEGVAARRTADGRTQIILVSDDNFRPTLQRTLLLLFEIE